MKKTEPQMIEQKEKESLLQKYPWLKKYLKKLAVVGITSMVTWCVTQSLLALQKANKEKAEREAAQETEKEEAPAEPEAPEAETPCPQEAPQPEEA